MTNTIANATLASVSETNRSRIMQHLYQHGISSRAQIAKALDLIPALKETGVSAIHLSAKRTMTSDGGPGGGGNGVMVCRTDRDVVRAAVAAAR